MRYKIKPKIGIGDIDFYATIQEFIYVFGDPNEEEIMKEKDEDVSSKILHYDNIGMSASFDEENNWQLTSIAISENDFHFNGLYLIGITKSDFFTKINEFNMGEFEMEEFNEDGYTSTLYHFSDQHMSFWFENDELQEIQWSAI